jgi:hypothetical protein
MTHQPSGRATSQVSRFVAADRVVELGWRVVERGQADGKGID